MRYLDFVALALALPLFLLADLPIAGYLAGGGAWIIQRIDPAAGAAPRGGLDDPRIVAG